MQPNFTVTDYIMDSSWLAISIFVLLAIVFASTTFYYWRKSRRMGKSLLQEQDDLNTGDADDGSRRERGIKEECVPLSKNMAGIKIAF